MTALSTVTCPILESASRLERVEAFRERLPDVFRVVKQMRGHLPACIEAELLSQDESLITESERLREELSQLRPGCVEGAVAQVVMAERDWLSGDPHLQARAMSMVQHAVGFLASRRWGPAGEAALAPSLALHTSGNHR